MLTCLIDNALAFAESTVEVHVKKDGAHVVLTVSDDGPGVSPDNRDKIFKRFFSARDGGTGLGLAIAKTIVEAHHGEIDLVNDEPLGGACFKVTLPSAE